VADRTEVLDWMRDGESFFLRSLDSLDDGAISGPSLLAGWTRAHVVAHVARNADALQNLLAWARTGVETPMYANAEQRDRDIAEGAVQAPAVLRDDARETSSRLLAAADALPRSAWARDVRTARGRTVPASEVPWMRCREVWIHAADLASDTTFSDIPTSVTEALIDDVAGGFSSRDDCPSVDLVSTTSGRTWRIGPNCDPVEVSGRSADLLGWLLGRSQGTELSAPDDATLPTIPRWL
jgi:maleylpyruvate isomerase